MNRLILLLLTASLGFAGAIPSDLTASDLTGTWVGKHLPAGNGFAADQPTDASLTLTRNGSIISGIFTGREAKASPIQSFTMGPGGNFTFWLHDSQNYLVTAQLAVSGDVMRGRMTTSTGIVMIVELRKTVR
jgi:hypothetical protein